MLASRTVLERTLCEASFLDAVRACDPALRVREALARDPVAQPIVGLAVGKAALAMARGAGRVARGLAITNADDGAPVPDGWRTVVSTHPVPDMRSVEAAAAAVALVESAGDGETVLALISGGASSLIEQPRPGLTLAQLTDRIGELVRRGASIQELNALRCELSAVKGGRLAGRARVPVVTLVVSDVIGDDPRVIGSGPTVLEGSRVELIAPMAAFGEAAQQALAARGVHARLDSEPIAGDVATVADRLAMAAGVLVAWGEPTVRVAADPGIGGRAQQLALELARRVRGSARSAFVAGSDGIDGSSQAAGAFVDGATWDAIAAAGIDPDAALARCDAGTALAAVGATFAPGPTGVNHADVAIVG